MTWQPLVPVDAVPAGTCRGVDVDACELVVWRTATGIAAVAEARCPHQWSHLGAEGVVDGDELLCTAHGWRFDRAGRGTKVNVRGRRDPKGDVVAYPVRERDGMIEIDVSGSDGHHGPG